MAPSDDASISSAEDWSTRASFTLGNTDGVVTTSRSKGVTSESAWVKRTYCMVNEGHQTQPNVLSWSADGEVFEIKDVNTLKNDLFRKYHGDTKFESFTRRLRRYGFNREKTEPLTKTSAGRGNTVVLAFRHEKFRRDRPDLLANLTIVSQTNEAPKASEDSLTCTNTLARLEKTQEDLRNSIKQFEEHRKEQKRRIDHLRQEAISKDETIQSLEFRLERLENSLLMAMGPARRQSVHTIFAPNSHGNAPQFRSQPTKAEAPSTFMQPLKASPSTFKPSQPLASSSLEREISALGLLPFLEDLQEGGGIASPMDDEPTLPRSKKMKLFHKNAHNIIDGIALSRQTTPMNPLNPFQKGRSAHDTLLDGALALSRQSTPLFLSLPCL